MPQLFDIPGVTPEQLIACPGCRVLYDGKSELLLDDGSLRKCPAQVKEDGSTCGTPLGEMYFGKNGTTRARARITHSHVPLKEAFQLMWQRRDFANLVLNEDRLHPNSFRRDRWYAELCEREPGLDADPAALYFSFYLDYFTFFNHARDSASGQAGSIWIRILNLPAHMGTKAENMIYVGTLTGYVSFSR